MGNAADFSGQHSVTTDHLTSSAGGFSASGKPLDADITDAINSLGGILHDAIAQLSSTLTSLHSQPTVLQQIVFAVFVAFISALSAYCFNYFHWKIVRQKERIDRLGTTLSSLIEDLEKMAVEYWTQDYSENVKHQSHAAEIHIKSKIRLVNKYIGLYVRESGSKLANSNKSEIRQFGLNVFDLVTGDEFESKSRKASNQKASKITIQCSSIRAGISFPIT